MRNTPRSGFLGATAKSKHMRLAHLSVTLSETKGLTVRFFALLRMTALDADIVKCTNVLWSDLACWLGCPRITYGSPQDLDFWVPRLAC
jgi:hypothetical protein